VYLAKRSEAEGWLVKPLDALRLRRAVDTVLDGGTWTEGVSADDAPSAVTDDGSAAENATDDGSVVAVTDGETVDAG
jgi:hypothetical protein